MTRHYCLAELYLIKDLIEKGEIHNIPLVVYLSVLPDMQSIWSLLLDKEQVKVQLAQHLTKLYNDADPTVTNKYISQLLSFAPCLGKIDLNFVPQMDLHFFAANKLKTDG